MGVIPSYGDAPTLSTLKCGGQAAGPQSVGDWVGSWIIFGSSPSRALLVNISDRN